MRPAIKGFHHHIAFQLHNDARVRTSLDTELALIREDDYGRRRAGDNWKREDIGIDWPFKQLPAEDITRFPYAVLEVKLQTHVGQEPPAWIVELINSHLVESCPRFSKYIHGVATLLEDKFQIPPFWLPQMDQDIRKPRNTDFGLDSFLPRSWPVGTPQTGLRPPIAPRQIEGGSDSTKAGKSLSEFEPKTPKILDKATYQAKMAEKNAGRRNNNSSSSNLYNLAASSATQSHPLADNGSTVNPMQAPARPWIDRLNNKESSISLGMDSGIEKNHNDDGNDDKVMRRRSTLRRKRLGGGGGGGKEKPLKRATAPVKMEPKVFFANERTFLNWLQFSVLLGTISLTLLNFGNHVTRISGAVLTVITLLAMVYALGIFHIRLSNILSEKANRQFHDRWGPTVLCVFLFGAYFLNFYTKFIQTGEHKTKSAE
ncbi:vacuolar transporter chaperone [Mortierella sp. GBA43]|nr:vacuolar transporter chaperone [Mortierella sp. GBA43]